MHVHIVWQRMIASNQESLGSESNQDSLGSESNQESLGSESNQGVSQQQALINQEVLAGSIGQASKEAQRTDAGKSIATDEQRTLSPVPSPGLQLRPEGLVTNKVADAHGATVVAVPGRRAVA